MATEFSKGKSALADKRYDEAIDCFTKALAQSPTSPDYLIHRSTAYQRAGKYDAALADADHAVLAAQKRGRREAILEAQFRRGCTLYSLGRYGDAQYILGICGKMNEKHNPTHLWFQKAKLALRGLPEADEKRKVVVKETPDAPAVPDESESKSDTGSAPATRVAPAAPATATPQQTPADKIRHEWYQNNDKLFFTLMAKGVPKEKAHIEVLERSLTISFPLVTGSDYNLTFDPLTEAVDPSTSTVTITPYKVEITLVKKTPGIKWKALEDPNATSTVDAPTNTDDHMKNAVLTTETTTKAPAYPTSSKSGPKDWDALGGNDDDDDDAGGDEANSFFKKLFKGASPDVQKAMMKSYTESNGTALSTNWDEVSKGRVETVPPEGMQANKWEP
ncbi:protein SGT1 homolog-like protein A [Teratosphaeria destructans]|uniref:Protein SGT1 homolog-like protein A n=1 Tax=Teratosphaeria destructans TaxID=418781 RepID=A0A9W7VZH0_9PEZI|nr:protein SGT1 homolog-like protein A [Teratosphaeria destructans]